jgi:hypothetical protein
MSQDYTREQLETLITLDAENFPNNKYERRVLDWQVIAVASINVAVGDWTAYIGAVPGKDHTVEWITVRSSGGKLSEDMANLLFPSIAQYYTWRD